MKMGEETGEQMPTPVKVAPTTRKALVAIRLATREAMRVSLEIEKTLKKRTETQSLGHMLTLVRKLAEIERLVLLARDGKYEPDG